MMAARSRSLLACVLAAAVAVAGCTRPGAAPAQDSGGNWLAMARGQVDVEGGLVRVATARDGRVVAVEAEDGDEVAAGAALASLDPREAEIGVGIAEANVAAAEAQVKVARARLPQLRSEAERLGEAAAAGAASGQAAEAARAAQAVLEAEIAVAEAGVGQARQLLAQARMGLDALVIRAPVAGRIVRRAVTIGDTVSVQGGRELFRILPARPRIVRAELGEMWVERVRPGMRASVVSDADEGTPVAASVLRVGEVFGPSVLTDDPVERASAREVECVLELEGGDFRIGQRVLVRFEKP